MSIVGPFDWERDLPLLFALRNATFESIQGTHDNPSHAWSGVVARCRAVAEAPWDQLPTPDIDRDVAAATDWLASELNDKLSKAPGIYLGLDTLNMGEGDGTNVEIGGSSQCDPLKEEMDWVFARNLRYGHQHLIRGLYELHSVYSLPDWEHVFDLFDFVFFLGYSGIVLAEAFDRLSTQRTLLAVWGFHDGDLHLLGRKHAGEFQRICK
jgi:hypothetical protein